MPRGMPRLSARKWATITLVVLIIGVALVVVSTDGRVWQAWEMLYSGWELESDPLDYQPTIFPDFSEIGIVCITDVELLKAMGRQKHYKVYRKRWSWIPGPNELRIEIGFTEHIELEKILQRASGQ